jgi:glycosyltransferase involved in cell wall biosynthesis
MNLSVDIVAPFFYPYYGGIENATIHLAKELRRYCHVRVLTHNWCPEERTSKVGLSLSKGLPDRETIEGVDVWRFKVASLPYLKTFSVCLLENLKIYNPDIIHVQGLSRMMNAFLINSTIKKTRRVLTTHGINEALIKINKNRLKAPLRNILRYILGGFDHFIALSKRDSILLKAVGCDEKRITIVPNGVDINAFKGIKSYESMHEKLRILCVARFVPSKGHEYLLEALNMLRKEVLFEATLIGSVGDEQYFAKIIRSIKDRGLERIVSVLTSVKSEVLVHHYSSSDIFVLPSLMETFPLSILEAMSAGLPIIATRVGAMPELIKDGVNGFLVQPASAFQLYSKLLLLMKQDDVRIEIGRFNAKEAQRYSWERIAHDTYLLYKSLMTNEEKPNLSSILK